MVPNFVQVPVLCSVKKILVPVLVLMFGTKFFRYQNFPVLVVVPGNSPLPVANFSGPDTDTFSGPNFTGANSGTFFSTTFSGTT